MAGCINNYGNFARWGDSHGITSLFFSFLNCFCSFVRHKISPGPDMLLQIPIN